MMKQKSFTLIELLVVIVIIGILAGVIMISTSSSINKANIAKLKVFEESVANNLAANMVSRWKLDEINGTTTPDAWGSNTGTLINGPILKSENECVSGKCLSFNGSNQQISCADNDSLDITNTITISFWFNADNFQVANRNYVSKYGGGGSFGHGFSIDSLSSNVNTSGLLFAYNKGEERIYKYSGRGFNDINDVGIWYHVAVTYDNYDIYWYINGIKEDGGVEQVTSNFSIDNNASPLFIGGRVTDRYFDGLIDDVRIYNAGLSSSQIKQNYIAGLESLLSKGTISSSEFKENIAKMSSNK